MPEEILESTDIEGRLHRLENDLSFVAGFRARQEMGHNTVEEFKRYQEIVDRWTSR
jgi:hypothetical protein